MKYLGYIMLLCTGLVLVGCIGTPTSSLKTIPLNHEVLRQVESELDEVMERIDAENLAAEIPIREQAYASDGGILSHARLGIFYHEVALNLGMAKSKEFRGYAQRSYDVLSAVLSRPEKTNELASFVMAYQASALALWSGEKSDLGKLSDAFTLFADAVALYGMDNYSPRFLRGSVSESLPALFGKADLARKDFETLIDQEDAHPGFVHPRVLSFTYWAWANNRYKKTGKMTREDKARAIEYLEKAIDLDPEYRSGRKKAEELLAKVEIKPVL